MQIEEGSNLSIVSENKKLLQQVPEYLNKLIELYENMHRDIDPGEQSTSYYRSRDRSSEGFPTQFQTISNRFVDTIAKLKANFLTLTNRYGIEAASKEKSREVRSQKQKVSNFDLFVSEYCENSEKEMLKNTAKVQIKEEPFDRFIQRE